MVNCKERYILRDPLCFLDSSWASPSAHRMHLTQMHTSSFFSCLSYQVSGTGANGLVSTRLVQELLKSGQKVAAGAHPHKHSCLLHNSLWFFFLSRPLRTCKYAGVPDVAAAQAVIDFAVRFELLGKADAGRLRLVELDFSDSDALAASLPRCARQQNMSHLWCSAGLNNSEGGGVCLVGYKTSGCMRI